MKNSKMKLNDLKVSSFKTNLEQFNAETVKGGATLVCGTIAQLSGGLLCTAGKNCSNQCSAGECVIGIDPGTVVGLSGGLACTVGAQCSNMCSAGNC